MENTVIKRADKIEGKLRSEHPDYAFIKKNIVGRSDANQCVVSVYEVPPGKAAYPYHYHLENEEVFYILKGQGRLLTPQGEREVGEGDFLFFPANSGGAHKLVNSSETEMLVYIDFDTKNVVNIAIYPDSGKIGVCGMDVNRLYTYDDDVDYYHGE